MNRFFAFGCSFTRYQTLTWADYISTLATEYENWGRKGAGNYFISNAVVECNLRRKITKDDHVIVMWSNVMRSDVYLKNEWMTKGNVFGSSYHTDDYLEHYVDIKGFILRDLAYMEMTRVYLDRIGCTYDFLSMVDFQDTFKLAAVVDNMKEITEHYKVLLNTVKPSVHEAIFNFDWDSRKLPGETFRRDIHPTPAEHLEYVKKVLPELASQISSDITTTLLTPKGFRGSPPERW